MANIYTCTTATGNIDGLSTETSGDVKVNYTLSSSTAGTAGGNSDDGTYEDVVAFDSGITLAGYSGVLTVNSVNGLSTKTQRTETRVLTHDTTATPQDKYYIDTILQTVTPPLPSPTTSLDGGSTTALIGHADTVDTRYRKLRVYSKALTQAEIDAL